MSDYLNASQVKYVTALSPGHLADPGGSTNAFDASAFTWGTVLVTTGSNKGTTVINVQRSGTSNGTFATFGASMSLAGSVTGIRSFAVNTSAVWHKVAYTISAASLNGTIHTIWHGSRSTPVNQESSHTSFSDITSG